MVHQSHYKIALRDGGPAIPIFCIASGHSLEFTYEWKVSGRTVGTNSCVLWVNQPGVYNCRVEHIMTAECSSHYISVLPEGNIVYEVSRIFLTTRQFLITYEDEQQSSPSPKLSHSVEINLPKSAKTSHVGMHFQQKNTSPKTNETSNNAHRKACTAYPHITARCIYHVPTIPTSFQPHPYNDVYVRWE